MIPRRSLLAAGPLVFAGCGKRDRRYFGKARPPSGQRLVFLNLLEPSSLDPALVSSSEEANITQCLFEGLTRRDPLTLEPRAALATHFESNQGGRLLTFYLRGHPKPRGASLFSSREPAVGQPARWSDGTSITAHDFVYSWRRLINPATGAPLANYLFDVKNAEEIYTGQSRSATNLALEAPDDFTLRVELRAPVPYFLSLSAAGQLAAVPRQAIERALHRGAASSWTQPGEMVVSGPFRLYKWHSYDRVVLRRNPAYYHAAQTRLQEISFVHIGSAATHVSLYKAGQADAMGILVLPPQLLPGLGGIQELHTRPALYNLYYALNLNTAPLDRLLLRYALNMALNKNAIASFAGAGVVRASSFVPPIRGYTSPAHVIVRHRSKEFDVLSYDPPTARELLAAAGAPGGILPGGRPLRINVSFPIRPLSRERAEILQQSWRQSLGIEVALNGLEARVWLQLLASHDYEGAMEVDYCPKYADPYAFLSIFTSNSPINDPGWRDEAYDRNLEAANVESDQVLRMHKLTDCEVHMLRSMPVIPLYFDKWTYLQKPFVRNLEVDLLAGMTFHDAWIDTNWRPS